MENAERMKRVAVTFGDVHRVERYEAALRLVGLEPVRNPESMRELDGLVLTGGTDVDPALYGQAAGPKTDEPDGARDKLEATLLNEALDLDSPVLAICRGLQVFNVVHGGTLIQDLPHGNKHEVRRPDPSEDIHDVRVLPGTKLAAIAGSEVCPVNSRHHQAVDRLGEGLVVSAVSPLDGVVEGLERPDKSFAVAVQWHPEDRCESSGVDRGLFEAFADAVEIASRRVSTRHARVRTPQP
jgi:putative glutamine amidotransferase